MNRPLFSKFFKGAFVGAVFAVMLFGTAAIASSTGTIDPNSTGAYKAAFLDSSVVADTSINFGKFTTESQYNITVSDTELRGYAWGSSVGWMVMNCADTTSGCSSTNGNFKVANDGTGRLSGYAWGENTGWINFGPFTNGNVSTVNIASNGNFGGTSALPGYAWSQNYGWIVFDCTNASTCTNTNWRVASSGGGTSGGGPAPGSGGTTPPGTPSPTPTPTGQNIAVQMTSVLCDTYSAFPSLGISAMTPAMVTSFVANSNGHCHFASGQSFQWANTSPGYTSFGPTDANGVTAVILPLPNSAFFFQELVQPTYLPFSLEHKNNNHPPNALFHCPNNTISYDNLETISNPVAGTTYYCVVFNASAFPVNTPPPVTKPPVTTPPPTTPPTTTPPTTTPPGTTTPPTTTPPGTTPPGTGGTTQPPGGDTPGGQQPGQPPTGPTTSPTSGPSGQPSSIGGLVIPPVLSEAFNNIIGSIGGIGQGLNQLTTAVAVIARTSAGIAITKIVPAVGVATTAAASLALVALANPFSLAELFLLPFRLWSLLMIIFGFKKPRHPWGTVYDSVTKQPIDPAYVVLMDMQGNEVATSITDIDGRYGFNVAAGTYKILVNKTNFEFPSKKLVGKTGDELYDNLYFGETITVKEEGEVIIKNIPLDQLNFDWNEFAKNEQHRLSYYRRSDLTIAHISNFFFWFGFIVAVIALLASVTVYNGIVFVLYVVMFIIRHYSPQFKSKGSIIEAVTDEPLPFAILHVLSPSTGQEITHKVADRLGNYYCLVPNGTYSIVIDRKNADASYTKVPVAHPVVVTQGYLKHQFEI